jgi:hypothetical protein
VAPPGLAAPLPNYSSLNDPHLEDYYRRKFIMAHLAVEHHNSEMYRHSGDSRVQHKGQALYDIRIVTGPQREAGTAAKLFITIKGTKGKTLRHRIKPLQKKGKEKGKFVFEPGSKKLFRLKEKNVGNITAIIVDNDGLLKSDGWFLDNITIVKNPGTEKEK